MKNKLLMTLLLLCSAIGSYGQSQATPANQTTNAAGEQIVFRFVGNDDAFYIPWQGNGEKLSELVATVDEYKEEIESGEVTIYVAGYSSALPTRAENLRSAAVRANRVKSELIVRNGIKEVNFNTTVFATPYEGMKSVVVVTLELPQEEFTVVFRTAPESEPEPEPQPEPKPEPKPEQQPVIEEVKPEDNAPIEQTHSRWSVGASVGLPFFWGDFTSISTNKTYFGISAGLQATYQASPLLGVTLSMDWAGNRAGSRDYANGYLLDQQGMTWYTPQTFATQPYEALYARINMFSAGLHLDVNLTRLFGPAISNGRVKVLLSPAVYGNHFSSTVYSRSDDAVYVESGLSRKLSLGLGGDLGVRYALNPTIDLQLKGTAIWITDNAFDNVNTVGYVQQNAMWGISAGVVWKLCTSGGKTNLLYRNK